MASMTMRSDKCGECGEDFVWDSDAGSAVCPGCGTLQDPTQVVLDAHIEPADNDKDRYGLPFHSRSTLRGFRNSSGWDLAGQGKQAAAERNKIAMRQYTVALAARIGHPALSTRALCLFELVMEKGHFRYGRKARLVAGASLAIALREGLKGGTVRDIAYLLNETPVALARVVTTAVALLEIKLPSIDPSWHLPVLQKQVAELQAERPPSLPRNLIRILKTIHLATALRTASLLSELVFRAEVLTSVPSPPTACAIFILALEGEAQSSLPHCGELAKALGRRFGASQDVVMRRYKIIYDQVEVWAASVPWLAEIGGSSGKKTSAKVAKRIVIARCLKDVVRFQEAVWRAKLEASGPLSTPDDDAEYVSSCEISSSSEVDLQRDEASLSQLFRPRKCRKTSHIDDVSQFLLSPLHAGSSSRNTQIDAVPSLDVASHLLTSDSPSFRQTPTRLQLLTIEKSVDEITDEELFTEGELDGFLRSTEEREVLMHTFDWAREKDDRDGADSEEAHAVRVRMHNRHRGYTCRVNIEALNLLLNDSEANMYKDDDSWPMKRVGDLFECSEEGDLIITEVSDSGEVVGPWRPLSPTAPLQ